MYPADGAGRRATYYLKPMNCPMHMPDLPVSSSAATASCRCGCSSSAPSTGTRRPGVLHGLTRVRGFTQDDAHIFCTPEQLADELASLLQFVLRLLRAFGLDRLRRRARRPGPEQVRRRTDEQWDEATEALRARARDRGHRRSWSTRATARSTGRRSTSRARRDRPALADVDDPGRLPAPRAIRPRVRRRRQRSGTGRS